MRLAYLTSLLILTMIGSGCETYQIQSDIPCPARPILEPITPDEQLLISTVVLEKIAKNQLLLKRYGKQLEARANCEKAQD